MQIKRIAVATDSGQVAEHFGRCPEYTVYTVRANQVVEREVIANPGHRPGFLPQYLAERGIDIIVAGGMGPRAQALFEQQGIKPVLGVVGPVAEAIRAYLTGSLAGGDSLCSHGEHDDHDCQHEE